MQTKHLPVYAGSSLKLAMTGKAPSEMSALQPYRGKPAVRNDRGDRGNVGIIEARSAPRSYPTAGGAQESRGDGTSHVLVLEQLDVEISLCRPRCAGNVAQPRGGEVERRLTVRKGAHDAGAPADLAQDALERVVGANPPPMLLWEGVVGERLLDRHFHQLGGAAQAKPMQLFGHSDGLLARCGDVLAGVDRLEHGRDLPHLGRGHMAEDVAVPVHDGVVEKVRTD
jgi:hypothetical protein